MTKRKIVLLMVAAFIFVFAGYVASVQETKGVVVKIEGSYLSILDSVGQMVTINGQDPTEFENIKVGDKVIVKDSKIFKEIHLASIKTFPGYMNEVNLQNIHAYPR